MADPLPCCTAAIDCRFKQWLSDSGGIEHPWMLENLALALAANLGKTGLLGGEAHRVRVAWIGTMSDGFTWAQRVVPISCPTCGEELELFVISSNAMFFLLRLLNTASTLIRGMTYAHGQTRFTFTTATKEHVEQVHIAMQMYRGYRTLSDEKLDELWGEFFRIPDKRIQFVGSQVYSTSVAWLLLHEIGHGLFHERAKLLPGTTGVGTPAGSYLKHQYPGLKSDRAASWEEELSVDVISCSQLAAQIAAHSARSQPQVPDPDVHGRNLGFSAGVLALTVFELYERYAVGISTLVEKDWTTAVEFRTHPPIRVRQHFMEISGRAYGGVNPTIIEPWRHALHDLFATYADAHPHPD